MLTKSFEFLIKSFDNETGIFSGYAATFNDAPDRVGDVIAPGAFTKSLAAKMPKMFWNHDLTQPIGVWTECVEDENGLFVTGKFANTELAKDVRELVLLGAVDALSIGGFVKNRERNNLTEIDLVEISVVIFPVNENALITTAKSLEPEYDPTDDLNNLNRHLTGLKSFLQKGN